jgi:predicted unusual protein kinase regulating ubiquinone biosynthesis (AarF/ABC1/UbiB family)
MMGQLDNLVPKEYIASFEPMLQQAPKTGFQDVKSIVEEELGDKIENIYSEFAEEPVASASLGQVHKAKLRSTGETVAVKVQHQWIKE